MRCLLRRDDLAHDEFAALAGRARTSDRGQRPRCAGAGHQRNLQTASRGTAAAGGRKLGGGQP